MPGPSMVRVALATMLSISVLAAGSAAGEPDGVPKDDRFRTEADDLAELRESDTGTQFGSMGAVRIPLEIDRDCRATVALYTPEGRLVRILGQVLSLKKGTCTARWDGLDLFGNLLPAGTRLEAKVFMSDGMAGGIRARYEFTVGHGNPGQPWGGHMGGTGDDRRAGGWLGDHSTPWCACAHGDKVMLGCFLAEHGHNLIMVDRDGRKMWGTQLAGWAGPVELESDGTYVWALLRGEREIHRVDPLRADDRGRVERRKLIDAGGDRVITFAAHDGKVHYVARNHELDVDHFRYPDGALIDHKRCAPQVLSGRAPTEFHISPKAAFSATFRGGGHPQAGARSVFGRNAAFVIVAFEKEAEFGSVILSRIADCAKAEVFALKPGLTYDEERHSPLRAQGRAGGDPDDILGEGGGLEGLDLTDLGDDWVKIGETRAKERFNLLSPREGRVRTNAFCVKLDPPAGAGGGWAPRVELARLVQERVRFVGAPAEARVMTAAAEAKLSRDPERPGWFIVAKESISDAAPVDVVLDYREEVEFDGIMLGNPTSPAVVIERFAGQGDPAGATDADWEEIAKFRGGYGKKLRSLVASKNSNACIVRLEERVKARALRFRTVQGYVSGKYAQFLGGRGGERADNPRRAEVEELRLLRLDGDVPGPPSRVLVTCDARTGRRLVDRKGDDLHADAMTFAPSGRLFIVRDGALWEGEITADGVSRRRLADGGFTGDVDLGASRDRVAVADRSKNAVFVYDHGGRLVTTIGAKYEGMRRRGRWDVGHVSRPGGVAIAASGDVWVAETSFAPKRVSRFAADGRFIAEHLGPPMYGGGGHLDPDLRRFYYRGVEHELDFAGGTSRVRAKNDACYSPESPALENSTFSFTGLGRPVYHGGRRYIVGGSRGGTVISILDDDSYVWRPAAVMGPAHDSMFLTRKDVWRAHFARMDLRGKTFIWCDLNDDGKGQIDEVTLAGEGGWRGEGAPPAGGAFGPGLSMWGRRARIKPHRFTPQGAPVYRFGDWDPFSYDDLAPHYPRNYTLGGPRSAKPGYSAFALVTARGALIQEGQPYVVEPDGSVRGGPATARPSDYVPEISGAVLNQPWGFAGSVVTRSALGEVAAVNSNNGYWYLWAADWGVIVATFFDGSRGGWGSDLAASRGADVTGRKQDWEGWGADFLRARDGNCYAVAGKGFHGISRIEGVDDFRVKTVPVAVEHSTVPENATLRPFLAARQRARGVASSKKSRKTITFEDLAERTQHFRLDGETEDWGARAKMRSIGPEGERTSFDVARSEEGVYVVFAGESRLANACRDWRRVFHEGFHFDVKVRPDGRSRSRDAVRGDRRIVFGRAGGEWAAVLYEYASAEGAAGKGVAFETPLARTVVARVRRLGPEEYTLKVNDQSLGVDALSLEDADDLGGVPGLDDGPGGGGARKRPEGLQAWSAEAFLSWKALGLTDPHAARWDFGVHPANDRGDAVGEVRYWSNANDLVTGDIALEASINPCAWGFAEK